MPMRYYEYDPKSNTTLEYGEYDYSNMIRICATLRERFEWAHRVALEQVNGVEVSTVLCYCHYAEDRKTPTPYETSIDGSPWRRYATRERAINGHKLACQLILNGKSMEEDDDD